MKDLIESLRTRTQERAAKRPPRPRRTGLSLVDEATGEEVVVVSADLAVKARPRKGESRGN